MNKRVLLSMVVFYVYIMEITLSLPYDFSIFPPPSHMRWGFPIISFTLTTVKIDTVRSFLIMLHNVLGTLPFIPLVKKSYSNFI